MSLEKRCASLIEELGLGDPRDITSVTPLTGGVASDIARVTLGAQKLCIKFALPKLRVAADWHAPVHRNAAEYAWLRVASDIAPESALRLLGHSTSAHGFAMEYIDGPDVFLWKERLLTGTHDPAEAPRVADLIGRVHAASATPDFDTSAFRNRDDFHAIRIEPYLSYTAQQHPDLVGAFQDMEECLYRSESVLIHGDASPKNILFRARAPILLDAECATMGDASFDPAFCLNHLALKAVHVAPIRAALLEAMTAFWDSYRPHVSWEDPMALEARTARLLALLFLARVDGKSPAEYLTEPERAFIRQTALNLIATPAPTITSFATRLGAALKDQPT